MCAQEIGNKTKEKKMRHIPFCKGRIQFGVFQNESNFCAPAMFQPA